MTSRFALRVALWIVRAAAAVVPSASRADWAREWDAELRHRSRTRCSRPSTRQSMNMKLIGLALGSLSDAAWVSWQGTPMDLHIKKVWLPGAASCLLFFGFYWVLIFLPFDKNRFQFISIPYLVLPFVGALGAYLSRRMKGSVVERILAALFLVFTFVALFAVRIVYGLFFEGQPFTLPHFLSGLSVTLVFVIGVGGLLLMLGAWPFCRPHLREQSPKMTGH